MSVQLKKPSELLKNTKCKWNAWTLHGQDDTYCGVGALLHEYYQFEAYGSNAMMEYLSKFKDDNILSAREVSDVMEISNSSPTKSYKEAIEYLESLGK